MSAFEQIQIFSPESPSQVKALDEITENEFQEELYTPKFEFFLREGMPSIREFSKALVLFSINCNNIVLENVEAIYDELLKKVISHGAYYKEMREALENGRTSFVTLVEDLVIYRELVKTTKKELKFFPLLTSYEAWLRSVVAEKPTGEQDTVEGKEGYLLKKLADTYGEYLEQVYGADDFQRLTNLALEQEAEIFMSPSRELRSKRIETRFLHSSKEPTQIKEAAGLSLPQYAVFSKYKKYFQGEKQTLPFLVPNESFYKLAYEQQTKIIDEIEARELFVKENLSRIDFPEIATDRMLPQDPLARIHPALRAMADKDPKKIKKALQEAAETKTPEEQTKSLGKIAEENTQKQLDFHLGAIDDNPLGEDLLNPKLLAEELTAYRAKYGGVLFTDKEIVDRLKKQKEHEFEKKFSTYIADFTSHELQEIKNKPDANSPIQVSQETKRRLQQELLDRFYDSLSLETLITVKYISQEIRRKLQQDLQCKFYNCLPLKTFIRAAEEEISKVLIKESIDIIDYYIATNKPLISRGPTYNELKSSLAYNGAPATYPDLRKLPELAKILYLQKEMSYIASAY